MFGNVINIKVVNSGASADAWTAFGFNAGTTSPSSGAAVTVNASPQSMGFAGRESQQQPYVTRKMKIKVTDTEQFNYPITITGQVMGELKSVQIEPLNYAGPSRGIANIIEIPLPEFVINGSISLSGTIDPGVTMNIVIEYDYVKRPGYPSQRKVSMLIGSPSCQCLTEKERNAVLEAIRPNNRLYT